MYVCLCMYYVCMFVGILIINVVTLGSTNSSRRKERRVISSMEVKGAFALGGEVRRLQIIYFLSHRMGRVDHPHLIRVHHLTRTGVYLRGSNQYLSYIYASSFVQVFDTVLCNI